MPNDNPEAGARIQKNGFRPLNLGYSPEAKGECGTGAQRRKLPTAPVGGTGEWPTPIAPRLSKATKHEDAAIR